MLFTYNSKMTKTTTRDIWWFNVSHPKSMTSQDLLEFNLWNTNNTSLVKKRTINLSDPKWMTRVQQGSTHNYNGREILKVNAYRDIKTQRFIIYFGHVSDGLYPI